MRRIIFLIAIFLLTLSPLMGQNPPVALPEDGNWPTIVGDSIMLIGPKQEALTEEQRYFNPLYLLVYPGKEHLKNDMIRAALCDCDPTKPNRRIGVFSVAPDKQVSFSQGNLQYLPAANIWKFADTQYEYLGNANKYLTPTFRNWVDLFGWSANNTTAPFGISTSMSASDYAGDFVDWGVNAICGDAPGTWRTLSVEEWDYLFKKRSNAAQLYSKGSVEGTRGMIVLPDNWVLPEGVQFTVNTANLTMDLDLNAYSYTEWQKMEDAGAVFLCVTGRRDGKEVGYLQEYGCYWSNTVTNNKARHLYFNYDTELFLPSHSGEKHLYARSVRLVHDTIVPKPEYVDLGLSVKWATFNVGASKPEDYGDYFAWGETEPKETYSWATYKWGTSSNLTKYNTTDGKTILDPEDDAAQVHWGDKWRMPTKEEIQELFTRCTWKTETQNGINGYNVIGPNGNSIFVPTAGWYNEDDFGVGLQGNATYYWTSTLSSSNKIRAYDLVFNDVSGSNDGIIANTRRCGFPIRPVYDDRPPKRIGVFSVAADKQVSFSQGNLQYIQSTDTWQFAANQLEYMGHKHYRNEQLADTIEYFGWSGKNSKTPWGISLSTESSDYAGEFLDWGTNSIAGSAPNTWRTLSNEEWLYICQGRKNADQLLGLGTIGTVTGLIILPDDWQLPAGLSFTPNTDNATKNQYTYKQWVVMENAGAVFIATSGYFNPKLGGMRHIGGEGHIRTNALSDNGLQVYSVIKTNKIIYSYSGTQEQNLQYAFAQRLVHDTIVPETIPDPCLVVKVNDTLSINMMCVEGGNFQMGATPEMDPDALAHEAPVHSVTLSDYYIGQIEVTQALWKTVMGTNPSTIKDNNRPVNNVSWEDCQVFIEKLNQKTGYSFRLPTEAEWEYAARGGNKSRGYKYAGSDNIDEVAWYKDNSGGKYQPFALKKPNELGIYDMSGNVFEWCQDWYGPYSADAQVNPQGPESGPYHMIRGGGWKHTQSNRVTYRRTTGANLDITSIGLRLVHDTIVPKVEPEYVDLGLSVKWATFNVGATSSNEIGNFYAWGEIEPKDSYTVNNYKWWNKSNKETTKYCTIDSLAYGGVADGLTELLPQDDVAHILKGEHWRMPNLNECKELVNGCTWTVSTRQGQIGFEGTSKINGNTIFLPVAGFRAGANLVNETLGGYWSSTLNIEKQSCAMGLYLNQETPTVNIYYNSSRQNGFLIRPVYDEVPDPCLVVKVNDTLSINMMCVEGGTFMMGAMEGDTQAKENEKPAHEVTLTYDYLIMQTEVTQGLWEAVMGEDIYDLISKSSSPTAKPISTRGDFPVGYVQLSQCLEFIDRLNSLTGLHFRMPTEAEWEYAARGGNQSKGYLYAGSNTLTQVAQTSLGIVAKLRPNELGIYDMSGNIAEMTLDYLPNHDIGYPSANAQVNPRQISPTGNRAIRGLRWNTTEINCRISHRNSYTTTYSGNGMGFRLVLSEEQDFRTIHFNGSYFDMSFVKGGTFKMGSDAPDAEADERPVHEVTLSDYYIGQTEVTQHLWKKVMGDENNPSATKGNNLPVTNITWNEAQVFVQKLSELIGMRFRLPTEAEWEYAARGGQKSKGYTYAGSNDIDEVGWYNGNSSNKTHAVGQKQPNELGIYDMTGNVWEYCSDWHMPYSAQAQTNPTGAATGEKHVLRGGCYHYDSKNCTNTNRHSYYTPDNGGASTGLRIVLEVEK